MRFSLSCIILFWSLSVFGQSLESIEEEIAQLQATLSQGETEAERLETSDEIGDLLKKAFKKKEVFAYPFNKLVNIGILASGDEAFRLINWNIPLEAERFAYRAFILFPDGEYLELEDAQELNRDLQTAELQPSEWYGALYYEIHPLKTRKKTYYTLVGWDGNNSLSNRKVLDALVIDDDQKVVLGLPVFQFEDTYLNRVVYEYAESAVMTLRYLKPKEAIVFDALEPIKPGLEGKYEFYGPSTVFSGYKLQKDGTWHLEEVMDMSRPKEVEKEAQFNFPDRPELNRKRDKVNPLTGQ